MGRKRTHDESARTKIVSARLKPETYDIITEHAAKMGLTRAGYIEHLIENKPLRIVRPTTDELPIPLLNELKRIGNNLNQMAHSANAGWPPTEKALVEIFNEIIRIMLRDDRLRRQYAEACETQKTERQQPRSPGDAAAKAMADKARAALATAPPSAVPQAPTGPVPYPTSPFVDHDDVISDAPVVQGAGPGGPLTLPPLDWDDEPPSELTNKATSRTPAAGKVRHDPPPQPKRFKLPWSLFVRSPRR